MTEHIVITDMTAWQLYGLIHLAIGIWIAIVVGVFYGYPHIKHKREKAVFWIGAGLVIVLPAYFGLTAIAPGVPDFASTTPEPTGLEQPLLPQTPTDQ